jgi:predicted dehydrogenase
MHRQYRLITIAPGHFHAALLQRTRPACLSPRAYVYAPLDADTLDHLQRIADFNHRADAPTDWELDIRTGSDYLQRCFREAPGHLLVIAGRNRPKIGLLEQAVATSLHVLIDKPWIIRLQDLPRVEAILREAALRELVIHDVMTERHEVTNAIQRALVRCPDIFGEPIRGTLEEPTVWMESVHCIQKTVAGRPLRRPAWFFDADEQGDALCDVGTHLVDLVQWMLAAESPLDYRRDVQIIAATRRPLPISLEEFASVTGLPQWPADLARRVRGAHLPFWGNTTLDYRLRGLAVRLNVCWEFESAGAGDTHQSIVRGTRARVAVRQGSLAGDLPEVYVAPARAKDKADLGRALNEFISQLSRGGLPGLAVCDLGGQFQIVIPRSLRLGHEAHFGQVVAEFLARLPPLTPTPTSEPPAEARHSAWDGAALLAKYYTTCKGADLASSSVESESS